MTFKPFTTPLIKYAGGKSWFVREYGNRVDLYLEDGGRYIDPFVGGGALTLALHPAVPRRLGDANQPLVDMYRAVQDEPGHVAFTLGALGSIGLPLDGIEGGISKDHYYQIRDWEPQDPYKAAARLIYLNKLGYNGLMRFNKKGKFNVPYANDKYRKSMVERKGRDAITSLFPNKQKFLDAAKALRRAKWFTGTFQNTLSHFGEPGPGDFLYLDPPYDGTYDGYTGTAFTADDQREVEAYARVAAANGAWVVAHNEPTELVEEIWEGWERVQANEKRQINSDVKGRHRVPCWIFTNRMDLLVDNSHPYR